MNIVWFVPALVGSVMVLLKVKSSYPPSPPSRSAQLNCHNSPDFSYLKSIWTLMCNMPYMLITLTIGGFALLFSTSIFGSLSSVRPFLPSSPHRLAFTTGAQ